MDKNDFLLEEYRGLRQEIQQRISASELVETLAVGAMAAIYTWLFAQAPNAFTKLLWAVPIVLAAFGAIRYFALIRRIMEIAAYIEVIENAIYGDIPVAEKTVGQRGPFGWERFLKTKRKSPLGVLISSSSMVLWLVLFVVATVLAIYQPSAPIPDPRKDQSTEAIP